MPMLMLLNNKKANILAVVITAVVLLASVPLMINYYHKILNPQDFNTFLSEVRLTIERSLTQAVDAFARHGYSNYTSLWYCNAFKPPALVYITNPDDVSECIGNLKSYNCESYNSLYNIYTPTLLIQYLENLKTEFNRLRFQYTQPVIDAGITNQEFNEYTNYWSFTKNFPNSSIEFDVKNLTISVIISNVNASFNTSTNEELNYKLWKIYKVIVRSVNTTFSDEVSSMLQSMPCMAYTCLSGWETPGQVLGSGADYNPRNALEGYSISREQVLMLLDKYAQNIQQELQSSGVVADCNINLNNFLNKEQPRRDFRIISGCNSEDLDKVVIINNGNERPWIHLSGNNVASWWNGLEFLSNLTNHSRDFSYECGVVNSRPVITPQSPFGEDNNGYLLNKDLNNPYNGYGCVLYYASMSHGLSFDFTVTCQNPESVIETDEGLKPFTISFSGVLSVMKNCNDSFIDFDEYEENIDFGDCFLLDEVNNSNQGGGGGGAGANCSYPCDTVEDCEGVNCSCDDFCCNCTGSGAGGGSGTGGSGSGGHGWIDPSGFEHGNQNNTGPECNESSDESKQEYCSDLLEENPNASIDCISLECPQEGEEPSCELKTSADITSSELLIDVCNVNEDTWQDSVGYYGSCLAVVCDEQGNASCDYHLRDGTTYGYDEDPELVEQACEGQDINPVCGLAVCNGGNISCSLRQPNTDLELSRQEKIALCNLNNDGFSGDGSGLFVDCLRVYCNDQGQVVCEPLSKDIYDDESNHYDKLLSSNDIGLKRDVCGLGNNDLDDQGRFFSCLNLVCNQGVLQCQASQDWDVFGADDESLAPGSYYLQACSPYNIHSCGLRNQVCGLNDNGLGPGNQHFACKNLYCSNGFLTCNPGNNGLSCGFGDDRTKECNYCSNGECVVNPSKINNPCGIGNPNKDTSCSACIAQENQGVCSAINENQNCIPDSDDPQWRNKLEICNHCSNGKCTPVADQVVCYSDDNCGVTYCDQGICKGNNNEGISCGDFPNNECYGKKCFRESSIDNDEIPFGAVYCDVYSLFENNQYCCEYGDHAEYGVVCDNNEVCCNAIPNNPFCVPQGQSCVGSG